MTPFLPAVALASAARIAAFDLESDDGGFMPDGDLGQWRWGEVRNGPGSGWDGARAWSTGLDRDYLNDSVEYLEIPVPDLAGVVRPQLRFRHWHAFAAGDAAWIEIDGGNGWVRANPLYGYAAPEGFVGESGGWETVVVDLTGYASPRLRLVFSADVAVSADGWTIDAVEFHDGDVAAPRMDGLTQLADTEDLEGPYRVEVDVRDDVAVAAVTLWWKAQGDTVETPVAMTQDAGDRWVGDIPAQAPGTDVRYRVAATDGNNEALLPDTGSFAFRVFLAPPRDLAGPDGLVVGTQAELTWSAPDGVHDVLGYEVWRGGARLFSVPDTRAAVPLLGTYDIFSVRALYEAGAGDPSDEVVVDAVVPEIVGIDPPEAWPGESVRVQVVGRFLLLDQGDVVASLGNGVTVDAVDVRDVDSAVLHVTVDPAASPGPRELQLQTSLYTLAEPAAFEVLDADGRPRVVGIDPPAVAQGTSGTLTIRYAGTLEGTPTVDLGEGIVVESVAQEDGAVRVAYACAPNAPIGDHAVTLDDGVRVLGGGVLEVEDVGVAPARTCAATPGGAGATGLVAALASLLARRRRR